MAFIPFNPTPMTGKQANPYSNLIVDALKNYQQSVQSAYMPRSIEADIFNKTISPLSNFAISPLAAALAPEQQQQIAQYISNALSGMSGSNKSGLFGQGNNQQPNRQVSDYYPQQNNSGSNESSQIPNNNIQEGAKRQATHQFRKQEGAAGETYRDENGNLISTPSGSTVQGAQNTITSYKDLEPILKQLVEKSPPLLESGAGTQLLRSQATGEAQHYGFNKIPIIGHLLGKVLSDTNLASLHKDVTELQHQAKSGFQHLGMSEKDAEDIVTFKPYDTPKSYAARLAQRAIEFKNKSERAKTTLKGAINLNANQEVPIENQGENEKPITNIDRKIESDKKQQAAADNVTQQMKIAELNGNKHGITAQQALQAREDGVKNAQQLREWKKAHGL